MYQQELNKICEKYLSFKSSTTLAQQKCQFESGKKQKLKFQFYKNRTIEANQCSQLKHNLYCMGMQILI